MKYIGLIILIFVLFPIVTSAQTNRNFVIDCDTIYPTKQHEIQLTLLDDFDGENNRIFKLIDKNRARQHFCDSINPYFFDNCPDTEHNGFIRFRNKKSELVGLLNRYGEVVVPAKYNNLSHVRNGFLTALIGADAVIDGEYLLFVGGENLLLDTMGAVHIKNFTTDNIQLIDFYSLKQINSPSDLDTTRINFLTTSGIYYSFENYLTAFGEWLNKNLLSDFRPERFKAVLYPEVRVNINYGQWQHLSADSLATLYYDKFYKTLIRMKEFDCEYFYSCDSFYPGQSSYDEPENTDEHPIVKIIITSVNGVQEHFQFYRTNEGYRLVEATFRDKSYGDMN